MTLISWQMIEPILQNIVLSLFAIVFGYLVKFLRKHINLTQWQHDNGVKGQIVRDMILFAQQTCADLSNSSKFTVAFEEASKKMKASGIQVSEDELKQSIEATLKQIKIEAGRQWVASEGK